MNVVFASTCLMVVSFFMDNESFFPSSSTRRLILLMRFYGFNPQYIECHETSKMSEGYGGRFENVSISTGRIIFIRRKINHLEFTARGSRLGRL